MTARRFAKTIPLGPASPYGVSKLQQFELAQKALESGMPIVYGRPFNLIGPGVSCTTAVGDITERLAESDAQRRPAGARGRGPRQMARLSRRARCRRGMRGAARKRQRQARSTTSAAACRCCCRRWSTSCSRWPAAHVSLRRVDRGTSQGYVVGDSSRLRGLGWTPRYDLDTSLRDGLDDFASKTCLIGAPPGIRTPDPLLRRQMLYPLS